MGDIESIVEVVFVIIFVLGQFLFRLFFKGMKGKMDTGTVTPSKPVLAEESLSDAPDVVDVDEVVEKRKGKVSVKGFRRRRSTPKVETEATLLRKSAAHVLEELEIQKARAQSLVTTAEYQNFYVLSVALGEYSVRIQRVIEQFRDAQDQKQISRSLLEDYTEALSLLDARLSFFDEVQSERSTSYAKQHDAADQIVESLCYPYRHGHPHGERYFKNMIGIAVNETTSERGGIYGVPVSNNQVKTPREWNKIAFAVAGTVIEHGRMASKTAADLGLPNALQSMSYFLSSGRLMSAGLVSAWMHWVMADAAATLQMGIAYGYGLLRECERFDETTAFDLFSIDKRGAVSTMPPLARLATVYAVLQKMAVFDLERFAVRMEKVFSQTGAVRIEMAKRGKVPLSIDRFRPDLHAVAMSLVDTPLSVLGNFTLDELVGGDFGPSRQLYLEDISALLRQGRPATDCTPTELAMAVSLAIESERNAESRIEVAALKSLSTTKKRQSPRYHSPLSEAGKPTCLADVFSAQHLPSTVMIGALSRNRGGLVPRR